MSTAEAIRTSGPATEATVDGLSSTTRASVKGEFPAGSASTTEAIGSAGPATEATIDDLPITTRASATGVVALALGDAYSMILKQDGSVWTTGVNKYGQLGYVSRRGHRAFLQAIPSGAKAIAAGMYHSLVLKQDGSVWTTGQNTYGQLGDGLKRGRGGFVQVISGEVEAVAAGSYHSLVITQDLEVWATGWNKYGQLGDGSTADDITSTNRFVQVMASGAKAIAAGDVHSIVLKQDGSVWAAGRNDNGQLGDGSRTDKSVFVPVMSSGAEAIAAGGCHTMVLKQDGSVWATGWDRYGQLGDGNSRTIGTTAYVQMFSSGVKAVAAGSRHSMVLNEDGSVWATGRNHNGQLGDGSKSDKEKFVQVLASGAKAIAAGSRHSMVLKQDGSAWATGQNKYGQLGLASTASAKSFVRFVQFDKADSVITAEPTRSAGRTAAAIIDGLVRLAAGGRHSLLLKQDGSVWSTGYNHHGQLGDRTRVDTSIFSSAIVNAVKAVAAGGDHSMVLKRDGGVWVTGSNLFGQLGASAAMLRTVFLRAMSSGAEAVAAGRDHSMILARGDVYAAGRNHYGQLGDGFTFDKNSFALVFSEGAKGIAAGGDHSIVLKQDGSVWSTGFNFFGQLGDGSNTNRNNFVKVMSGNVEAVAAGTQHSLVLGRDGSVWASGRNSFGQLGDGSTADKNIFTMVVSSGVKAIDAGYSHSIILKQDGSVWVTGSNVHGQLGDRSTTDRNSFVKVKSSGGKAVAAGSDHSMILAQDGSVWATGWNLYGQLGDGSITSTKFFIRVAEIGDGGINNPATPTKTWLPSDFAVTTRASGIVGFASTMAAMRITRTGKDAVFVGTPTPPLLMTAPTAVSRLCPKCGTIKKSSKLSCCAPGAAWFDNCGDAGDTNLDHTWIEGIQACKKVWTMTSTSAVSSKGCPKCGTITKSGELSCCARGGAWFNKCGDAGDKNFDHTWVEGMHACETTTQNKITVSSSTPAAVSTAAMTAITTAEARTTTSASAVGSKACPKCGTIKKSGKLSCCARGGAWFKKCGDAGDTNFDHTWVEGIHACKRGWTTVSAPTESSKDCPKCVMIKKSGKLSCCARGGAWFKNCGDVGDINFDHTWAEGMHACKGFMSAFSSKPLSVPVMLRHDKVIDRPLHFTPLRNDTDEQQLDNIHPVITVSNTDTTNYEDCVELAKITVYISLMFMRI